MESVFPFSPQRSQNDERDRGDGKDYEVDAIFTEDTIKGSGMKIPHNSVCLSHSFSFSFPLSSHTQDARSVLCLCWPCLLVYKMKVTCLATFKRRRHKA